ncbi:hypothetical protein DITRI_Ditri14bG0146300 [Diplodiscus trichospermus]
MDQLDQSPSFTLFLTFFLLFMVFQLLKLSPSKSQEIHKKSASGKLPIIGNLHQLTGPLPPHTLRDLAKQHGPLMWLKLGEVPTLVKLLENDEENLHDRAFECKPRPIIQINQGTRSVCSDQHHTFECRLPVNLSEKIYSTTSGITARAAFWKKSGDEQEFIRISIELSKSAGGFSFADMYPSSEMLTMISGMRVKLERLHKASDRMLEKIINEHKEKTKGKTETNTGDEEEVVKDLVG